VNKTPLKRRGERGFTLIELLMVIAVISILASLGIPNLVASRLAANETGAIAGLKSITDAQLIFKIRNLGAGLATPRPLAYATLANLETTKLVVWPRPGAYQRGGYAYADILASPDTANWGVTAFPVGLSGTQDFAVTNDGFIRTRLTTRVAITTLAAAQALSVIK
jgi:prepilin-type N-terminal cleavage/methylation domain-containing protein